MKLMHILVHVLPKTRFIDFEYFVNTILTLARLKTLTAFFSPNNKSGSYRVLAWNPLFISIKV